MPTSFTHRPDIDGLRALAILGVLAFHAFPQAMPGGFAGVDVFFVISGYVVSLSVLARASMHGTASIAAFYARRVRRLFPALCCLLATVAFAAYVLLPTPQLALLGKHILSSAAFAQNLVLWQEAGYFDAASHEKWLLHLWSLGIEEQFYILLPLLFLLKRKGVPKGVLPGLIALLAVTSLALSLWQSRHAPSAGFYWPLGRFWEFLLGVALAVWHQRATTSSAAICTQPSIARQLLAATALISLGLAFAFMNDRAWQGWHFPGLQALWPVLATGTLLCTAKTFINQRLLSHAAVRYIGLISYPLYLWHWPIMAYLNALDPQHLWAWTRLPGLLLAFGLAAMTFHFVEQPMRRLAATHPRLVTGGLTAGMLVAALMGYSLWKHTPTSWSDRKEPDAAKLIRWDESTLYRDTTCLAHPAINPSKRDDFFCRGDPESARWLILGDSHANAVAAGLMKAMPGQWLNLGGGGCMPFDGVDSGSDELGLQCPRQIPEAFIRFAVDTPRIQNVLINVRGAFYVNATEVGGAAEGSRRWLREASDLKDSAPDLAADNVSIFRAGVARTLRALGHAGKHVVWVLNTPEPGADVNACLKPRAGEGWLGPHASCAVTLKSYEARNKVYREIVLSEVSRWNEQRPAHAPAVKVLDPSEVLCDSDSCPLVKDGKPLYRDGDHLSIQGSDLLAQWLLPQLPPGVGQ